VLTGRCLAHAFPSRKIISQKNREHKDKETFQQFKFEQRAEKKTIDDEEEQLPKISLRREETF